jgi:hypothetical protein
MSDPEWPAIVCVSLTARADFRKIPSPRMKDRVLTALATDLERGSCPPDQGHGGIVLIDVAYWPRALLLTVRDPDFWVHDVYHSLEDDLFDPTKDEGEDEDYGVLYRVLSTQQSAALKRPLVRYLVARILPRSYFEQQFLEV